MVTDKLIPMLESCHADKIALRAISARNIAWIPDGTFDLLDFSYCHHVIEGNDPFFQAYNARMIPTSLKKHPPEVNEFM